MLLGLSLDTSDNVIGYKYPCTFELYFVRDDGLMISGGVGWARSIARGCMYPITLSFIKWP